MWSFEYWQISVYCRCVTIPMFSSWLSVKDYSQLLQSLNPLNHSSFPPFWKPAIVSQTLLKSHTPSDSSSFVKYLSDQSQRTFLTLFIWLNLAHDDDKKISSPSQGLYSSHIFKALFTKIIHIQVLGLGELIFLRAIFLPTQHTYKNSINFFIMRTRYTLLDKTHKASFPSSTERK